MYSPMCLAVMHTEEFILHLHRPSRQRRTPDVFFHRGPAEALPQEGDIMVHTRLTCQMRGMGPSYWLSYFLGEPQEVGQDGSRFMVWGDLDGWCWSKAVAVAGRWIMSKLEWRGGSAGLETELACSETGQQLENIVNRGKDQWAKETSQVNKADTCPFKGQIQPETHQTSQLCPLHSGHNFVNIFSLKIENCISPQYLHSMMTHKLQQSSVHDNDGARYLV